ncbi:AAA domain-containing protein [Tunicatimonas pelagia]|uniref:AAA domain-containing protein n=1 Tax=Tunicatimonas pelagia TaxID=931531 RepID=UPI002666AE45|nr:AAA domain-containing protein [Tunicatimonas pelagia]WKN43154.1 AAA domain-containing protein [Tunicatimonas pelagia]
MQRILQSYLRRLTNLSSTNRSLYLPRLSTRQHLDIQEVNFSNNVSSFKLIEWLIADGKHEIKGSPTGIIPLTPVADSRQAATAQVSQVLRQIVRTHKFLTEEQGTHDLYLGWPFVRGQFQDGTSVRCPLLFFPIELRQQEITGLGKQWVLSLREGENIMLNRSFLLSYAHRHNLPFNELLSEPNFDEFDRDSRVFRTSLYQLFKESNIELNFNQELFVDELISFRGFTKEEFIQETDPGILKLFPEAVLGIFPQSGSYLIPDYQRFLEHDHIPDIEEFFASKLEAGSSSEPPTENESSLEANYRYVRRIKEEQIYTPYDLDAYQEQVLREVKLGKSLVVQGPPGTGKSQLITNLASDFIAQGKRVLVVCQKRAALDVVYRRLKEKGIHQFAGLVHDFKNDRATIYAQIRQQIDALYEYELKNNNLDSIFLERQFLQASRQIEKACEELDEFKQALYDQSEAGVSVKELYLTSQVQHENINVKQEYRHFKVPELPDFLKRLHKYVTNYLKYDIEQYPFAPRKSFAQHSVEELKTMKAYLEEIPAYKLSLVEKVQEVLKAETDFVICENIQHRAEDIDLFLRLLENPKSYEFFQKIVGKIDKDADPLWLANMERIVLECYEGNGVENTLEAEELGKFQQLLQQAEESRTGIIKWLAWQAASKDKKRLADVFQDNQLEFTKEDFQVMNERLDNRLNLEHNLTKLRERVWVENVPERESSQQYDKQEVEQWFLYQKQALQASLLFKSFRNFNEYFGINFLKYPELKERISQLLQLIKDIPQYHKKWQTYFTPSQVSQLNQPEHAQQFADILERDFESLVHFDTLKDSLLAHEKSIISRLTGEGGIVSAEAAVKKVDNSLRMAWVHHIETKFPILRIVSSARIEELENELQQAIAEKKEVSQAIVLMKLRERTYYDVEYNRQSNPVTYRDLNHQVSKKRKVWPLRKLIGNFQNELFDLVPCWLASPETVSAIFPLDGTLRFDLVIFDEASQCFSEKGIPAMYRGQQVVVVGDEQQLQPNDLYQVRWEEDTSDEVADALALEATSLLDLAKGYLPTYRLEAHYRSKSLELIDFSNQAFYDQRLKMLPDRRDFVLGQPAIQYIRVDGVWKNQINEPEASKVIDLLKQLHSESTEKSIGVITFNVKQQDLLLDLIDTATDTDFTNLSFVKNIENVQGDECDIIIFSTAYAPNEKGKVVLQFGSLNADGGENRLNVAVTRAREKIYLVTSVLPEQLKVENTKNRGPKLLKQYLEYAHQVSAGNYQAPLPEVSDHRVEWFLDRHLQQWAEANLKEVQLQRRLPFADLTILAQAKNKVEYLGLIMTDDDLYFQSPSAKEAHVYRSELFQEKYWKFKNVYSRQLWQNADHVFSEIKRFIQTIDSTNN